MSRLLQKYKSIPISFGGASISGEGLGYGFGDINEDNALSLINHAFDRGIRIFDAAPIYGFGLCEKRLGKALSNKREDIFLVSKSGVSWHDSKRVNMSNSPQITLKMVEQSLRDFNSDYIDLYMIHWPDEKIDIRKTMEVLTKQKEKGRIKHIGLCNTFDADINKALEIDNIDVLQCQLNYFEDEVVERLLVPYEKNNMSFMSWGTFDKGILTGRVNKERTFNKSDCRSWAPWWKSEKKNREKKYLEVQKIEKILLEKEHSLVEFSLAHNLYAHESVDSLLCGMRSIKQMDETLDALENLPSIDIIKNIKEILS